MENIHSNGEGVKVEIGAAASKRNKKEVGIHPSTEVPDLAVSKANVSILYKEKVHHANLKAASYLKSTVAEDSNHDAENVMKNFGSISQGRLSKFIKRRDYRRYVGRGCRQRWTEWKKKECRGRRI